MYKRIGFTMLAFMLALLVNVANSQVERIEKGNLVIEGVPETPQSMVERMTQYQNTRSASLPD